MEEAKKILLEGGHSLVIVNRGKVDKYSGRGIDDLYRVLKDDPEKLVGASVADKIIGKGAAALMVAGGVAEAYATVMSERALTMLSRYDVRTKYDELVAEIINRKGTGVCPVENICTPLRTPGECVDAIGAFWAEHKLAASLSEEGNVNIITN